jgi:hypothetical protein
MYYCCVFYELRASPMVRRISGLNRGRFGPFASGHRHERGIVLPLDRLGWEQAQRPDVFRELATWPEFKLFLK